MRSSQIQKRTVGLAVSIGMLIFVAVIGIAAYVADRTPVETGIFSWEKSAIMEKETFFEDIASLGVTEVYQEIAPTLPSEKIVEFLEEAQRRNVDVYMLVGEAEWALQEDAEELIKVIDRVLLLNSKSEEVRYIKGIMVDVEPYSLEEWKQDSAGTMRMFAQAMKTAYAYANMNEIEMILCIPYHYDKKGFEKELEELTAQACDGIAVMNYYRDKEIQNMETEAACAAGYDKSVITIYEMKAAGTHGLTEKNTYHELGFEPVTANFRKVRRAFPGQDIKMAYHDYEAVKENAKSKWRNI